MTREGSRCVVVGAGLAGSATAWHLARRGWETTLVERTRPAAPDGSSHGSARIFRYAYADPFWVRLVQRAALGYAELERLSGTRLITPTGSLDHGPPRDPRGLARTLLSCGVEHELVGPREARERWPGVAASSEVLWHPGAGVVDAERAVAAQVALAEQHGARVLTGWPVARIEARAGGGYRLTSEDGSALDAERVVVAAGAWLPRLLGDLPLPAGFLAGVPPLEVSQEQAFHFPHREVAPAGGGAGGGGWPTTIDHTGEVLVYSLPGGRDAAFRGQKVAQMRGGRRISSAAAQDGVVDPVNRARVVRYVQEHLPGLVPEPYAETTCLFTSTPDEDFLVDGAAGITVVSPCSGHGAKFAPLVGELAADVVAGGDPVARFAAGRGRGRAPVTGRSRRPPRV